MRSLLSVDLPYPRKKMNHEPQIPHVELQTERLTLRTIAEEDADELFPLINDPMVLSGLINVPYPYPRSRVMSMIKILRETMRYGESIETSIILKASSAPIGTCSLRIDRQNEKADIGYWLGKQYWNKGYMTEAIKRLIEFAFTELHLFRLHARCFERNRASARILTKCGMKLEGCARGDALKDGEHLDVLDFGLLASEYFEGS